MAETVALIDYGAGNLHSVHNALKAAGAEGVVVTADPAIVRGADRIVLPGVGAYAACASALNAVPGMRDALDEAVRGAGRPFLGICVGMQLIAARGLEFEVTDGLGWIPGDVAAIVPDDPALKIPHMGWNSLDVRRPHALLDGIKTGEDGHHAYFVHSFHLVATDPKMVIAETNYGGPVTAMVGTGNIAGTQFHPEKSQFLGLKLIANFLAWTP